jgi:hypothetical protein
MYFIHMVQRTESSNTEQTANNLLLDLLPVTYCSPFTKLEGAQLLPL